jgi:pimeloyl-ACP methyl ester carboxylesterase
MGEHGFADVRTARLAWWSDGPHDGDDDGAPLVLVHAGVADARMWEPLLPALTPARRVVRFDMRGYGETRAAPGAFAPSQDVVRLLDALGIARAHVVGASFGGLVALELAATAPARVASLVLLAPALPDIEPSPQLLAFAEAEEQAIRVERIDDAVQINVRMWAGDSAPEVQALVADMQRAAFALQLREGAEPEELTPPVSQRLATITVAATIAIGERDVVDFARIARRLERELPRAGRHEIAAAGHLLALDRPAEVARLVLRHLAVLTP